MTNNEGLERQVIELIATDRIDIPISSMSGKLKRRKPVLGEEVADGLEGKYKGERVYARVSERDEMKARGMKEGIAEFSKKFPRYGEILNGMIEEERAVRETHLYFGINEGSRLTADDYLGVMKTLGFTEAQSRDMYPVLMDASHRISRKRDEERSVMIG